MNAEMLGLPPETKHLNRRYPIHWMHGLEIGKAVGVEKTASPSITNNWRRSLSASLVICGYQSCREAACSGIGGGCGWLAKAFRHEQLGSLHRIPAASASCIFDALRAVLVDGLIAQWYFQELPGAWRSFQSGACPAQQWKPCPRRPMSPLTPDRKGRRHTHRSTVSSASHDAALLTSSSRSR